MAHTPMVWYIDGSNGRLYMQAHGEVELGTYLTCVVLWWILVKTRLKPRPLQYKAQFYSTLSSASYGYINSG